MLYITKKTKVEHSAEVIRKNVSTILDLWVEGVKADIPELKDTERLVLLNVLPLMLEDIALIMDRSEEKQDLQSPDRYKELIEESREHGNHRASVIHFTGKRIIREHMVLHQVMIMVLRSEKAYNEEVGILLSMCLETSMSHSIDAFSNTIQKMREKLVATLAHDIRNPLAAAQMGISTFQFRNGEELFEVTRRKVLKSLRRTNQLVEDILDAISIKSGEGIMLEFSEVDILEGVELVYWEAIESFSNDFEFRCRETGIMGVFASTAVRRVVENLLTNAVKYGAPDRPITLSLEDVGEKIILRVHNYGNPIPPEKQKDIFRFLSRNKESSGGSLKSWGIGLAFVKMAAEAHGGHAELKSDQEHGTLFSIHMKKYVNEPGRKRVALNFSEDC